MEREGYTLVPLELYWKNGRAKLQFGIAKGKKQHDKRAVEKERDWQRDKQRLVTHAALNVARSSAEARRLNQPAAAAHSGIAD